MADHKHRTLKGWDGTLHRAERQGLYVLNYCACDDMDDVMVASYRDEDDDGRPYTYWHWDVNLAGQPVVTDGLQYRTRREAVDAALAYVHHGELAGRPVGRPWEALTDA